MKNLYLFILLFFKLTLSVAQYEDSQWIFGGGGATNSEEYKTTVLDFRSGHPIPYLKDDRFAFTSQNASICDERGDFVFYTNGASI